MIYKLCDAHDGILLHRFNPKARAFHKRWHLVGTWHRNDGETAGIVCRELNRLTYRKRR